MEWSNADSATRTLAGGGSVTFRNRFPATPSSITFSALNTSSGFSGGSPSSYFADRDGFGVFSYQTMAGTSTVWWFGNRVDPAEIASIVADAAAARNGWKVILARCAPTTKPRSALQLAREMIAARDLADRV
jgi:hypothetical protein